MSNALAIAHVTLAFHKVLDDAVTAPGPARVLNTSAKIRRPDEMGTDTGVSIFLYDILPEPARRNDDLPTRGGSGNAVQRPRAAVKLRYLLTFHGEEAELVPHRVAATVVRALHARPILTQQLLQSLAAGPYADADTADQGEPVRLVPIPLGLEELSKLWSTFKDMPYRLSLAYEASVVLLEPETPVASALPVATVVVRTRAAQPPFIRSARSLEGPGRPVTAGGWLVAEGANLVAPAARLRVGAVTFAAPSAVDGTLRVRLEGSGLRAGLQAAQVIHEDPASAAPSVSNLAAFLLHPVLADPVLAVDEGAGLRLRATVQPPVGRQQRVALLLNEMPPSAPPPDGWRGRRHRLEAWEYAPATPLGPGGAAPLEGEQLDFEAGGVPSGAYLARIEVDGAASGVTYATPGSAAAPQAVVP